MSDTVPAVPADSSYDEVARKLMEENANAIRAVYEAVLADPRTTPSAGARRGPDPAARRHAAARRYLVDPITSRRSEPRKANGYQLRSFA